MGTFTDRLFGRTKKKEEVHTATTTREWDKEYTAEEVHAELTSKFLLFMEDIKRTTEYNTVPDSVRQEYETLKELGFINSKNAELTGRIVRYVNDFNKKHEENIEALRFMKKAWETFGRDVMVVRYDHFFDLIKKYNLVCGTFDRYTGTIPPENLAEIARAMETMKCYGNMVYHLHVIRMVDTKFFNPVDFYRFNMFPDGTWAYKTVPLSYAKAEYVTELASKVAVYNREIRAYINGLVIANNSRYTCFIAAPAQEMLPYKIQVWDKRVVIPDSGTSNRFEKARVRTYDPFICSLTKYGVMIFTKWGDEAQDDIIKQYEALSKYINGGQHSSFLP